MNRGAWFVVAVLIAVIGCSSIPLTTNYDYDTTADFTAMKNFGWMPPTGNAVGDDLLVKRIRSTVNAQLQAKGRTEVAENPDFLIAMQLSGKTTYGGSTAVGASVGIPVGRAGTISVGGGKIVRDDIYGKLRFVFQADYKFYRKHRYNNFHKWIQIDLSAMQS
jgi:hypothetical protein